MHKKTMISLKRQVFNRLHTIAMTALGDQFNTMIMHFFVPPGGLFRRLAPGGFSFYYKRKCCDERFQKSLTPTFILEPIIIVLSGF